MDISECRDSESDMELDSISQEPLEVENMDDFPRSESPEFWLGAGTPHLPHQRVSLYGPRVSGALCEAIVERRFSAIH